MLIHNIAPILFQYDIKVNSFKCKILPHKFIICMHINHSSRKTRKQDYTLKNDIISIGIERGGRDSMTVAEL